MKRLVAAFMFLLIYAGFTPLYAQSPAVTITVPGTPSTITTGGVSQIAIPAQAIKTGGWITNPPGATESLFVCPAGGVCGIVAGGGTYELKPSQTFNLPHALNAISVNAATTGHAFSLSVF